MADAKVQVEGQWIDHISDKAKATLRDLRNEFSLTSLAEKALGNLTSLSVTTVMHAAAAEIDNLSRLQLEMERNSTRLGTALKLTGQYTTENVKALKDLADLTESGSGFLFDDQEILRAEAYAVTIGGISTKQMPQLIEAASNLAAVLNSDLQTGMEAIVRGGFGMERQLKTVGIEVSSTGNRMADTANIVAQVNDKFKGFAEQVVGPVEKRLRSLADATEDNKKQIAAMGGSYKEVGATIGKVLSDLEVGFVKLMTARQRAFGEVAANKQALLGNPGRGVSGPWGLLGTPGWAQGNTPTLGSSAAFIGPAAPPGGSASAQSSFVSDSEERARKLQDEIDLYIKLAVAKRDALLGNALPSELSSIATAAGQMGAFPSTGPSGRSAYGTNANWHDYFQTKDEADKEKKAFDEAHARAASVASTLVSGLRMVEQQGKITFESIGRVLERMLVEMGMQQLERGLTNALTSAFSGGGEDVTFDYKVGR